MKSKWKHLKRHNKQDKQTILKLNKKEEKILNKKKELIKEIKPETKPETKTEKIHKSKVAPEPILESSSSKEEVVVIKKKKKPKKKRIIIEDSSEESTESPEPVKERKMKSQLNKKSIIKMNDPKTQKKDPSFDTNKWFI